jgi:putative tricarboxylic transport membrane protein
VTEPGSRSNGPHAADGDRTAAGPPTELSLADAVHEVEQAGHEHRPPTAGPVTNAIVAAVVILLGSATLLGSWSLGVGSARTPDSGTWPFLVSVVLVVLAVVLLVTAKRTTDAERFSRGSGLVLAGLATMVVFVAVVEHIGFEIPAALLCFVWLRFLGHEGWRTSIIGSAGVVAAFYGIFVAALSVPVPHLF